MKDMEDMEDDMGMNDDEAMEDALMEVLTPWKMKKNYMEIEEIT
jgi:hypothetical protein